MIRAHDRALRSFLPGLRLRFADPALEAAFRGDYERKTLGQVRLGLVVGLLMYAFFGILDSHIVPEIAGLAYFIRFAVVCPMVALVLGLSHVPRFLPYLHATLALTGYLAGVGIVAMCALAAPPGSYLYYAGLLLCSTFYVTFFQLRFGIASLVGWAVFFSYEAAVLWVAPIPPVVLYNNTFFFLTFNITGMVASYTFERFRRADFLQRRTIQAQNAQLHEAVHELDLRRASAEEDARRDPLTGLFNRREFFARAGQHLARPNPAVLAILLIDLDHFKQVNDLLGHSAGDEALVAVAGAITSVIRATDVACRYGGEEFAILLPGTDAPSAAAVGQRLLERLRRLDVSGPKGQARITASIGLAAGAIGPLELSRLIDQADRALYRAKHGGRDRLELG